MSAYEIAAFVCITVGVFALGVTVGVFWAFSEQGR